MYNKYIITGIRSSYLLFFFGTVTLVPVTFEYSVARSSEISEDLPIFCNIPENTKFGVNLPNFFRREFR